LQCLEVSTSYCNTESNLLEVGANPTDELDEMVMLGAPDEIPLALEDTRELELDAENEGVEEVEDVEDVEELKDIEEPEERKDELEEEAEEEEKEYAADEPDQVDESDTDEPDTNDTEIDGPL
jgi:hypothetical protein